MTQEIAVSSHQVPRVLHFAPGFRSGGIESLIMGMHRSADPKTLQLDLLVDTCEELPEFAELRAQGGRVFQMGRYLDAPVAYQRKLNTIFKQHAGKYAAVHCHSIIRALPVLLSARKFGIERRILHSHTDSLGGSKLAYLAPMIAFITRSFGTDFLACSERAGKFFFNDQPFRVFPNFIRCEKFLYQESESRRIRNELGMTPESLVVGHTGRFTYQKNHDLLIRVFSEIHRQKNDSWLLLLGEGPLEPKCRALANKLGVEEFIIFVGLQKDVSSYLSAMDVFILPSHYEGFCISLLEAQANGLPCIASDVVPSEVKITQSIQTCSLEAPIKTWAQMALEAFSNGRDNHYFNVAKIRKAGYDIDSQGDYLLDLYLRR